MLPAISHHGRIFPGRALLQLIDKAVAPDQVVFVHIGNVEDRFVRQQAELAQQFLLAGVFG